MFWKAVLALIAAALIWLQRGFSVALDGQDLSPTPSELQARAQGRAICVHTPSELMLERTRVEQHTFKLHLPGPIWEEICREPVAIRSILNMIKDRCATSNRRMRWTHHEIASRVTPFCSITFNVEVTGHNTGYPAFDMSCFLDYRPCAEIDLAWPTTCACSLQPLMN